MKHPSTTEDNPRIYEDQSTQTSANEDGWLVRSLVFGLRIFLVFVIAFARAVVIVAGDKTPDLLFDQVAPAAVVSSLGSLGSPQSLSVSASEVAGVSPRRGYYVIFIGRDVGYTTSRQVRHLNSFSSRLTNIMSF